MAVIGAGSGIGKTTSKLTTEDLTIINQEKEKNMKSMKEGLTEMAALQAMMQSIPSLPRGRKHFGPGTNQRKIRKLARQNPHSKWNKCR